MPPLTIGGTTVKALTFQWSTDERGGGGLRRTINGEIRGRSDWNKAAFTATLYAESDAELATLRTRTDPAVVYTVGGDLLPSPLTMRVQQAGEITAQRSANGWFWIVPIVARQT